VGVEANRRVRTLKKREKRDEWNGLFLDRRESAKSGKRGCTSLSFARSRRSASPGRLEVRQEGKRGEYRKASLPVQSVA